MVFKKDNIKKIRIKVTEEMLDDTPLMEYLIQDAKNKIINTIPEEEILKPFIIELMVY